MFSENTLHTRSGEAWAWVVYVYRNTFRFAAGKSKQTNETCKIKQLFSPEIRSVGSRAKKAQPEKIIVS